MIMLVFAFYGLLFIMPLIGASLSARTTQVKEGYSGVSTPTIGIIVAVLLVANVNLPLEFQAIPSSSSHSV